MCYLALLKFLLQLSMVKTDLRLQVCMVLSTMAAFLATLAANEWLFARLEFAPGINWIYLPAGMRLLCTLLFAEAGAIGLLLVSWGVCFLYFFPNDVIRSFIGGILAAAAPYLAYRTSRRLFRMEASLATLSPARLLFCIVFYSLASPLLHHIWFALRGETDDLMHSFVVMFIGDLSGTLLVVYSMKLMLSCLPRPPRP
jgi:hypothetical protein